MNSLISKIASLIPFVGKYIRLDQEEKVLLPKVREGIERVMREGTPEQKKKITEKLRAEMKKCKMEVSA